MFTQLRKPIQRALIVVLAIGILILAAVLLTPSKAPAVPPISWSPSSVAETILAGGSKTVSVSFTARIVSATGKAEMENGVGIAPSPPPAQLLAHQTFRRPLGRSAPREGVLFLISDKEALRKL